MGRDRDVLGLHSHSRATRFGEEDGFPIKDVGNDKRGRLPGMTEGETGGHVVGAGGVKRMDSR